ncbi:MAG: 5'/3'-nucleotidase SurE [Novosphingobium sp.]|nr:5'/3'-nucleotidase SurE [Novosphingobium sp.]
MIPPRTRIAIACAALLLCGAAAPAQNTGQIEPPLRILVTNDDGVSAEGIAALAEALRPIADVVVAAPAEDNSGRSQSLTIFSRPLAVDTLAPVNGVPRYAVHGTPADSVVFGLLELGKHRPFDMVVSGVNHGENVGSAVHVSGTVGAARQAVMLGVPGIAVSQQVVRDGKYDFTGAARFAAGLARELHAMGDKAPRFVSVNVPTVARGVRFVPAGGAPFEMAGLRQTAGTTPGTTNYRVEFRPTAAPPAGSDTAELAAGMITVSVLSLDTTDRRATAALAKQLGKRPGLALRSAE